MRKIISAIVVDPKKAQHNYKEIKTPAYAFGVETNIDFNVVENTENILKEFNKFKGFDCLITIGNDINFAPLNSMSFEFRKKWVHLDEFSEDKIVDAIVATFKYNINRDRGDDKLFSIFTCTFNTTKSMLLRLYESLVKQTYKNWNWWILDDSDIAGSVCDYLTKLNDPRIFIIKNVTNHGNIGFNKHVIASACDGDYLVEVDHDDELTPDCLEYLYKAFRTYSDIDFAFSYAFEEIDGVPMHYDEGLFALGQAKYGKHIINGVEYNISETADVNALTVRHIVGLPNHVRCWKKDFYHRIGGHNIELSVMDDMDLLIRTFLNTRMCKIPKVLYIQHEGTRKDNNGRGSTTQGSRLAEIRRLGALLHQKYDKQIHQRIKELGFNDFIWEGDDENGFSQIRITTDKFPSISYTLEV